MGCVSSKKKAIKPHSYTIQRNYFDEQGNLRTGKRIRDRKVELKLISDLEVKSNTEVNIDYVTDTYLFASR